MLLNLGLNKLAPSLDPSLRKAPNIVAAPKSNIDVNAVLGLAPSQYEGLQKVGNTGYFYGDNKMYEAYKPSPNYFYKSGPYGTIYHNSGPNAFGIYSQPSYSPFGGYSGGWQKGGGEASGTIYKGDQAFRPISEDVTGFSKSKPDDSDIYNYDPSMAYVYANTPRPAPVPTPNVTSFLSTPTTMATPTGNYGAGRFLDGGLLGSPISYGLPNGETTSDS